MKTLYLIRHAKSSWNNPELDDFDRPLNQRGIKNAPMMGQRLLKKNIKPDLILSSPAKRALTTAKFIAKELSYPEADIQQEQDIYEATSLDLLKLICKTDDQVDHLFLFGHNPGISYLAAKLCNINLGSIPTCAIVALSISFDQWIMLSEGTANLVFYDYPKNLNEN